MSEPTTGYRLATNYAHNLIVCWHQEWHPATGACSWAHFKSIGLLPSRSISTRRRLMHHCDRHNLFSCISLYIHTYIHKEYWYRAYYSNSKSLYALRSLNKKVFSCRLKVANDSPGCRRPDGRLFQTRGRAAEKLLSPNLLWVRGTTNDRMSLELDRSGRRLASDSKQQSSMRYAGATPSSYWWTSPATLNTTRWRTGNQCSRRSTGVMWSRRLRLSPGVLQRSAPTASGEVARR